MDRETQETFDRIEWQLKRIAHILEIAASNQFGCALATPCVSCGCAFIAMGVAKCPVCGQPRKEDAIRKDDDDGSEVE